MEPSSHDELLARREFLARAAKLSVLALSLPTLLQACARRKPASPSKPAAAGFARQAYKEKTKAIEGQARVLNGDVLDFKLTSDGWEGVFGFVKMRLHRGLFNGKDVYFVRTDASDEAYAEAEKLVWVPKLTPLAGEGLSSAAYFFSQGAPDQAAVFAAEPGRDDYTPARRVHQVTWKVSPRKLASVDEIKAAQSSRQVSVDQTNIILNAPIVKWSSGEMPVDGELKSYLGQGHLIEAPDTSGLTVTFKLSECFPNTRYFVADHSIRPAAEMTKTVFSPGLHQRPSMAGATGRTNVFMNGLAGPGPMGFQPSAFDFPVGDASWSPYWDHYTYAWKKGVTPRLLRSQAEVHKARDEGQLDEFPGVPDTKGQVFTVNCPAPISAPNVFAG